MNTTVPNKDGKAMSNVMTQTLIDHIGQTPLVEIRHLNTNPAVRILAKQEYINPGGTINYRAAL